MNGLFFEDVREGRTVRELWEAKLLADLRTSEIQLAHAITGVSLVLPTQEDACAAFADNVPLTGTIAFTTEAGVQGPFEIPLPYHGVFIAPGHDPLNPRANRLVWDAWLADRVFTTQTKKGEKGPQPPRTDDLEKRICVSFPVWLRRRVLSMLRAFFGVADRAPDVADRRTSAVKRWTRGAGTAANDGWKWAALAEGLVPLARAASIASSNFVRIDPENVIELAGRLTSVRRFRWSRSALAHIPARDRQNHPSFAGRICPLETPESEQVGLRLQLARGAWVDLDGTILPAPVDDSAAIVSWGSALVPFLHHNDGARTMMGAKNMRQAMRVAGAEAPCVTSGGEGDLLAAVAPLVAAGLCPPGGSPETGLALGCDLLVAYLPWYGWNVEDAVVVSSSVCTRLAVTESKHEVIPIAPTWQLVGDLLSAGSPLTQGTVIATFARGADQPPFTVIYADAQPGTLTEISFPARRVADLEATLSYTVTRDFPLEPGDKLMGRHGNKGIVARIVPPDEMPHLPDGTPVDILLNPHGVLSRLNPAQLLETHLGWLFKHGTTLADLGAADDTRAAGVPVRGRIDHAQIPRLLAASGLDARGSVPLSWTKDGVRVTTDQPVVVGYQHFFRLHHIPTEKAQARRGGSTAKYAFATGQAAHGRAACGGQRLGEMETWALAAYPGSEPILAELLGRGDAVALRAAATAPALGESGFAQSFADLLAGLCVKTAFGPNGVSFVRWTDDAIRLRARQEVTEADAVRVHSSAFACPHHADRLAFGGRRFTGVGEQQKSLTLAPLLAAAGWTINGPLVRQTDGTFLLNIEKDGTAKPLCVRPLWKGAAEEVTRLPFEVSERATAVALLDDILPVRVCSSKCKKGGAVALAGYLQKAAKFGELKVLCPCADCRARTANETFALQAVATREEKSTGGVCDAAIFGSAETAFVPRAQEAWGFLELPEPLAYPAAALFGTRGKLTKRQQPIWQGQSPLRVLPILPLRYRMPVEGNSDPFGYGGVLAACASLRAHLDAGAPAKSLAFARARVVDRVASVFEKIADRLCGKLGLVRREGLGRRVDRSCRLVLAPNPELALDEVGVPATVLWELVGDQVPSEPDDPPETPFKGRCVGWDFPHPHGVSCLSPDEQFARLNAFLAARAEPLRLLVNRQPSLHKYSMQAFRIRVLAPAAGMVLQLPPLCFKGFAADCDGDEVAGYLPLSDAAQRALAQLSPACNLISAGDGKSVLSDDRDFRTGSVLLAHGDAAAAQQRFASLCADGAADELAAQARRACAVCTETGASFGFYDLWALRAMPTDPRRVLERLEERLTDAAAPHGERTIARLVCWKANGHQQIEQFLDARSPRDAQGVLQPMAFGAAPRGVDAEDLQQMLTLADNLLMGLDARALFASSFNARASFCDKKLNTGLAGDLTRRLVYALRGRPGGLVAAQTIGERGTQLAMKSAHAGGSQVDIAAVRKLILKLQTVDGQPVTEFAAFVAILKKTDAYKDIKIEHLQILWEALTAPAGAPRGLEAVLKEVDAVGDFESLARAMNRSVLERLVTGQLGALPITTPAARVMFNQFERARA